MNKFFFSHILSVHNIISKQFLSPFSLKIHLKIVRYLLKERKKKHSNKMNIDAHPKTQQIRF